MAEDAEGWGLSQPTAGIYQDLGTALRLLLLKQSCLGEGMKSL